MGDWWQFPERELRRALERSELEMFFQPVFNLAQHRVTGAEALVRWNHPEKGLISASRFIRAAERIGIITPIVDLSLRQACTTAVEWLPHVPDLRVSVNLSDSDLQRRDLISVVSSVLTDTSLAPEHLELEVSERFTVDRRQSMASINMKCIQDLGIRISLDRFGREYGSMLTLRALPVRKIKIDRTLVTGVADDPQVAEIVRATLDIAKSFDVEVVAVGVETEDQLEWLRTAGCDQAQGNLLGAPIPVEDFYNLHIS